MFGIANSLRRLWEGIGAMQCCVHRSRKFGMPVVLPGRGGWLKRGPRDSGSLGRQLPDLNNCTLKKVSIREHGNKGRKVEFIRKTAKALNSIYLQCGIAKEQVDGWSQVFWGEQNMISDNHVQHRPGALRNFRQPPNCSSNLVLTNVQSTLLILPPSCLVNIRLQPGHRGQPKIPCLVPIQLSSYLCTVPPGSSHV